MLVLGGTEVGRTHIARQARRHHGVRVDTTGPLELGLCLLQQARYDLVVAFYHPELATRFAKACVANRICPPLAVLDAGLRHQRAQLQRVLAAAYLPVATFIQREADGADVKALLGGLMRPGASIAASGSGVAAQRHAGRCGSGLH